MHTSMQAGRQARSLPLTALNEHSHHAALHAYHTRCLARLIFKDAALRSIAWHTSDSSKSSCLVCGCLRLFRSHPRSCFSACAGAAFILDIGQRERKTRGYNVDQLHREQMGSKAEVTCSASRFLTRVVPRRESAGIASAGTHTHTPLRACTFNLARTDTLAKPPTHAAAKVRDALRSPLPALRHCLQAKTAAGPRLPKEFVTPQFADYQFFNMERLDELFAKKRDWWHRYQVSMPCGGWG